MSHLANDHTNFRNHTISSWGQATKEEISCKMDDSVDPVSGSEMVTNAGLEQYSWLDSELRMADGAK